MAGDMIPGIQAAGDGDGEATMAIHHMHTAIGATEATTPIITGTTTAFTAGTIMGTMAVAGASTMITRWPEEGQLK